MLLYSSLLLSTQFSLSFRLFSCDSCFIGLYSDLIFRQPIQETNIRKMKKPEDEECMEILLKSGGRSEEEDNMGLTPLCLASEGNYLRGIQTLAAFGSNFNYKMEKGKFQGGTALHFAAANSEKRTVELLVQLGGELHLKDWRGRTPLHWSAREGNVEVMIWLLENSGIDLYATDNGGMTLLHLAAAGGNIETAKWLLKRNFDIEIKESTGWTPLHCAADSGEVKMINLLLDSSAKVNAKTWLRTTPLHFAALRGEKEAVEVLLKRGADLNALDQNTWTPLCLARSGQHAEVVTLLQSLGGHNGGSSSNRFRCQIPC